MRCMVVMVLATLLSAASSPSAPAACVLLSPPELLYNWTAQHCSEDLPCLLRWNRILLRARPSLFRMESWCSVQDSAAAAAA